MISIFTALLGMWFGGALFYAVIAGPAAVHAGPAGIGFIQTLAKRHGTGAFYAVLAFLTTIAGIWAFFAGSMHELKNPGDWWAGVSVVLAILALVLGASANRIAESHWIHAVSNLRGAAATPEQGTEVIRVMARAQKINTVTTTVVGLALICAILSRSIS